MPDHHNLQPENPQSGQGISLFELFSVIADNWKILLFLPLIASVIAVGIASLRPPIYESVALQAGDPLLFSMYNTTQIQDHVVKEMKYARAGEDIEAARGRLATALRVTWGGKDKVITIRGTADNPDDAVRMVQLLIAQAAVANKRRTDAVNRLKQQYELALERDRQYGEIIANLTKRIGQMPVANQSSVEFSLVQLLSASREANTATLSLAATLEQWETFDLIQPPSVPITPTTINLWMVMLVTYLVFGFGLLFTFWLRANLKNFPLNFR